MVRNFADPDVACVSGQLVYQTGRAGAGDSERSYWDYEKFMKRRESELSSLIGADGSIYAVRRSEYVEIDNDLISDLVEPLALVQRGKRVVYEPEAVSVEEASTTYSVEFRPRSVFPPAVFGEYCTCGCSSILSVTEFFRSSCSCTS